MVLVSEAQAAAVYDILGTAKTANATFGEVSVTIDSAGVQAYLEVPLEAAMSADSDITEYKGVLPPLDEVVGFSGEGRGVWGAWHKQGNDCGARGLTWHL